MANERQGVLASRTSTLVFFVMFACFSAWSWLSVKSGHADHDAIYIAGLAVVVFIIASLAYKSPLQVDRIAFGAVACAFVFAIIAATVPLGATALLVVKAAKSLMWTVAAVVALVSLLRGARARRSHLSV